ncbi:hypothetical protein ACUWCL_28525, partial [Klebsiella pneumoniae]|uniref:hypothetical protein n=1 Tax=Klebsiella pneumoniae TaxID=573 RepID=UPI0040556FC7
LEFFVSHYLWNVIGTIFSLCQTYNIFIIQKISKNKKIIKKRFALQAKTSKHFQCFFSDVDILRGYGHKNTKTIFF